MKRASLLRSTVSSGIASFLIVLVTALSVHAVEQPRPAPDAPQDAQPAASGPAARETAASLPAAAEPTLKTDTVAAEPAFRLYMPDGQLKSHSIRVYLSQEIQPDQEPRLMLLRSHAVTKKAVDEARQLMPGLVAPGQEWIETVEGVQVRRTGTLLLFDLSGIDFGPRAMIRVMPVLSWMEGSTKHVAVGSREVNVGNSVTAVFWTAVIAGLALLFVMGLAWRSGKNPILLLSGADGHLSIAKTQVACWTVAVGSVVLGYGFIRLEVPSIPLSLLVLMGASLTTGGIGYFKDAQDQKAAVAAGVATTKRSLAVGDLVNNFTAGQPPELSLAKAQMLFWTLLLLVLFMAKSVLDGAIWEVPWPLVALMGFSQAGYLAPKLAPKP